MFDRSMLRIIPYVLSCVSSHLIPLTFCEKLNCSSQLGAIIRFYEAIYLDQSGILNFKKMIQC